MELAKLLKCFKDLRGECDAYALDMGSLRASASRVVTAATKAAREAEALGSHEMVRHLEHMASGIGDTRDKLDELHRVAVALAGQIAKTTRDFDLASRRMNTE